MDNYLKAVFLIAGAMLGWQIPVIAQKLALYKCSKKGKELPSNPHYTTIKLKLGLCVLNGAVWFLSGIYIDNIWVAILMAILFSVAVLTAIVDIRIRIVPNELVLLMLVLGLAFQVAEFGISGILTALLCMFGMIILFSAVAGFVGFDKVGAGDVKLAGTMGLVLGFPGVIAGLVIMSVVFVAFTLIGLLTKRLTLKTMVPFAPFMMTGLVLSLLYIVF